MRVEDLDIDMLLRFTKQPGKLGGLVQFAGERALIVDAVSLGVLRAELISSLGTTVARGILTRFGFAHGWRVAEALRTAFPWDDEGEWRMAGAMLHGLRGVGLFEPIDREGGPLAEAHWHECYEAEQHVIHLGQADEPVCWTLCGFGSGYLSACHRREIYFVEEKCVGKGDAVCHVVGQPREAWGDAIEPHLPFYRKEVLDETLRKVTESLKRCERRLAARRRALAQAAAAAAPDRSGLVALSEPMRRAIDLARRVAKVDSTALITGESGAGKERIARLIHDESSRSAGPFVAINCGAVASSLLESELFGHARGAFTGALQDRPGLFEAAQRGTLLLDEIGEVPPDMQVRLLRVLQEREVRRVGENRTRPVDVRVVAATNRDLAKDVEAGRFRQDLYYRLRVVEIRLPPLRDRREDILPLAGALLAEIGRRIGRKVKGFEPDAADRILRHPWPGNVRELQNAIERAMVVAGGDGVRLEDLPEEVRAGAPVAAGASAASLSLEAVEREHILAVLRANGGSRRQTAEQLEIGIATLHRKLKSYESSAKKLSSPESRRPGGPSAPPRSR